MFLIVKHINYRTLNVIGASKDTCNITEKFNINRKNIRSNMELNKTNFLFNNSIMYFPEYNSLPAIYSTFLPNFSQYIAVFKFKPVNVLYFFSLLCNNF